MLLLFWRRWWFMPSVRRYFRTRAFRLIGVLEKCRNVPPSTWLSQLIARARVYER